MILELPVTPFSRKVLLHQYQTEPITPRGKRHPDLLYHQLFYRPNPDLAWDAYVRQLTTTILINVPDKLARRHLRESTMHQIGYLLYIHHMDDMMKWVEAQLAAMPTPNAWASIESYYARHGITEDDFSIESAYKRWQRYQDRQLYDVRETARACAPGEIVQRAPLTAEQCKALADVAMCHLHQHMYSHRGTFLLIIPQGMLAYCLSEFGRMTYAEIADLIDVHRKTVQYRVHQIRNWLRMEGLGQEMESLTGLVRRASFAS